MASSRILGPDGQPIQLDVLREEISAPSTTGIRQVWHGSVANNLTPQRLARILHQAAEGDAHAYLTLAEEMEERDMHYGSVLGTRKQAVVGLDVQVEAASDDADDVRRADAVRALIDQPEFGEMVSHLTDALGKSYAVSEIVWDRSGREWQPMYEERDPRWFRFDRDSGRKLRLLDERDTSEGLPLPPFKFLVHLPRIRSGLPIRGGLARLAAPSYMCKAWSWKDWMAFADIFGLPMRVGRYGPNTPQEDINKLINAIANLGSDAAAVVPDSVKIEFNQASQVGGAGDFFEKLATFWDKQISKGVLGQTMTADDGASLSQAKVHNDVRMDLLEADAKAMSNTLQRMLVVPFCTLNFGAQFKPPRLRIVVPEPDNTAQLVDAVSKLVPVGFRVEQSVIRDKLGLPDPAKDAEVFVPPPTAPAVGMPWPAAPSPAGGPSAALPLQQAVLDGAALASLRDIVLAVQDGTTPRDSARVLIELGFPQLGADQIERLLPVRPDPSPATPSPSAQAAPPARASNAEQGGVGDPVDIGAAALADAVDPLVATWVEVLAEMAAEAGDFETLRARLDARAEALSLDLIARQLAQGMAVARLAGRADIADLVEADAAEGDGRARNAETLGAGVINRGWEPAAQFFMRKLNVPTARWNDLWQGEHARAFTVAGAMRDDLLADIRALVDEAINGRITYDEFHDGFLESAARRGWTGWTGDESKARRAWRTRVVYQTNLSTAHAAGRYAQMTEPETLAQLPYWQYRHNTVNNPRAEHKAWDGLVLRADDPWWKTHYPPNGWMCRCDVRPVSDRMLRRMGKSGPDQAPGPGPGDPPPEWAYNVGAAGARGG
jgi:phage gp29-like protein